MVQGKVVSAHIHPLHKEHRSAKSHLSKRLGSDTVIFKKKKKRCENQRIKIAGVIPLHFKAAMVSSLMGSG